MLVPARTTGKNICDPAKKYGQKRMTAMGDWLAGHASTAVVRVAGRHDGESISRCGKPMKLLEYPPEWTHRRALSPGPIPYPVNEPARYLILRGKVSTKTAQKALPPTETGHPSRF